MNSKIPKNSKERSRENSTKYQKLFQYHGLEVVFLKTHITEIVNFLDFTLDLTNKSVTLMTAPICAR